MRRYKPMFLILTMIFCLLLATNAVAEAIFSPSLNRVISKNLDETSIFSEQFSIFSHPITGETTVAVLLKFESAADASGLVTSGVELHTVLPSGIATAWIPVSSLDAFRAEEHVEYVELSAVRQPLMDISRPEIGIDDVHAGQGLPQPFKGEGVIVGVIDTGIDYDHPDFKNANGSTRILYIWDQCATGGVAPAGYNYGNECDSGEINGGTCSEGDNNVEGGGHGTHVAGTAAGNGRAPNPNADYTGIAPKADIIFVNSGCPGVFSDTWVIDATNYIFTKAQALGKPAVINMSFGGHDGPHDGTSLYEQMLTEMTGPGKILVIAAGNEGANPLHLGYQVDYNGSFSIFQADPETELAGCTVWYSSDYQMDVMLGIVDPTTMQIVEYTGWIAPGQNFEGIFSTGHLVIIDATEIANPQNGDRHVDAAIVGTGLNQYMWAVGFSAHNPGTTAEFDCWAIGGTYGSGDVLKTVGIPGTANNVITVGAYNTKNQWVDMNGNVQDFSEGNAIGNRASFSSVGPTRDGRLKPEISAPGQFIVSALTSDIPIGGGGIPTEYVVSGGYYQKMQGTSMACPHVAGVVALMLQHNPLLSSGDVTAVLANTARSDAWTDAYEDIVGPLPNIVWGYGKIDGYAAVSTVSGVAIEDDQTLEIPPEACLLQNYPNPFNPTTTIQYALPGPGHVTLKVYNSAGQLVRSLVDCKKTSGFHRAIWDGANQKGASVTSGIYFYQIEVNGADDRFVDQKRMVLLK
ncbi:MAG: hypothetical protein B6244_07790 [Candidatus Cloacimonetes bacterium 4572_55]|nr:MAG: hypothetical protein B6244_07790 [Candidatus Cloacimonetes bacterium 4572_55]